MALRSALFAMYSISDVWLKLLANLCFLPNVQSMSNLVYWNGEKTRHWLNELEIQSISFSITIIRANSFNLINILIKNHQDPYYSLNAFGLVHSASERFVSSIYSCVYLGFNSFDVIYLVFRKSVEVCGLYNTKRNSIILPKH